MQKLFIITSFVLCFSIITTQAQCIKRQVIGSVGAIQSSGNLIIHSTFGQPPNAGTISDGNNFLRQGFQQPLEFTESPPDLEFNIYDVFTPNSDGVNDYWVIEGIEDYPDNVVVIYNRWGNTVYEQQSYTNTWDGKNDEGEHLPSATYYYVVKLNDNADRQFAGSIDLIR